MLFARRYDIIIKLIAAQTEYGRLAQLVEHLLDVQEVTGSSPVPSTRGKEPSTSVGGSFCFAGALRDGVVYSAWFNNSEVVEETNMEDNKSMNVKKTVKSGITFGSALAMVISYTTWKSVGWAIFHGLLSWVYVVYFLLRY